MDLLLVCLSPVEATSMIRTLTLFRSLPASVVWLQQFNSMHLVMEDSTKL